MKSTKEFDYCNEFNRFQKKYYYIEIILLLIVINYIYK